MLMTVAKSSGRSGLSAGRTLIIIIVLLSLLLLASRKQQTKKKTHQQEEKTGRNKRRRWRRTVVVVVLPIVLAKQALHPTGMRHRLLLIVQRIGLFCQRTR
jgi:ABC-type Fe3+ transport system permease subunit